MNSLRDNKPCRPEDSKMGSAYSEEKLSDAWESTQEAIKTLSCLLRSLTGCQDAVIRLCLCNGSRMDVYSFPEEASVLDTVCNLEKTNVGCETYSPREESPSNEVIRAVTGDIEASKDNVSVPLNFSTEVLESLSIKELRMFFTALRKTLGLKSFDWPECARRRFAQISNDPIPSRPGRAHSGKANLLLMLNLSVESDERWNAAVRNQLNVLDTRKLDHSSNVMERKITQPDDLNLKAQSIKKANVIRKFNPIDGEEWIDVLSSSYLGRRFEMAKNLPKDTRVVVIPKHLWVSLETLLGSLQYPVVKCVSGWYIQRTPPDGNCMFSAILTAAKVRGVLPSNVCSVASLRSLMQRWLEQLSRAGRSSSPFRREWLASCVYDLDGAFEELNVKSLDHCLETYSIEDIERFLAPLRMYVLNWSKKLGSVHWGGLLRIELSIVGSITNSVIEVLHVVKDGMGTQTVDSRPFEMCDTRQGNRIVSVIRRDLVFPVGSTLPSVDRRFMGPTGTGSTDSGWLGPYPVLRVLHNGLHYDVCTSRFCFPIRKSSTESDRDLLVRCFTSKGILTEPYSSLRKNEMRHWQKACHLINEWKVAMDTSPELGQHADIILFQSKSTALSVSMLSRLQNPDVEIERGPSDFMLNDEIITCYMHLLERRNESMISRSIASGTTCPPKTRYMDSWFYQALSRGLSGPRSRKQRSDLKDFSIVILPALVQSHWVLAVCYVREGAIGIYDPFNVEREDVFRVVHTWAQAQLPAPVRREWSFRVIKESRNCAQIGGIDCGVYICKAAESIGLGLELYVSQWDIQYVRQRMIVEFMMEQATDIRWPRCDTGIKA